MIGPDFEVGKNENKDKNVVDAEAPLHEVRTEVLKRCNVSLPPPHKTAKAKGKYHPKNGLNKRFAKRHGR